jgi:hypothetical protein
MASPLLHHSPGHNPRAAMGGRGMGVAALLAAEDKPVSRRAAEGRQRRFCQNCLLQVLMCGSSCRTTFNNELWTSSFPL